MERRGKEKKKKMPTVWVSLKRSLQCKSEASVDVHEHDPTARKNPGSIITRKTVRSGCSRSIANLKDVIHGGSKRHSERPTSCSPRSIGSSEFLNPIAHEVILSNSTCELKITGYGGGGSGGAFVGTLWPGTPGPKGNPNKPASPPRKSPNGGHSQRRSCVEGDGNGHGCPSTVGCHKCGEQFSKWEALEQHHLSNHAVTELVEGDSSRKIVEIICRATWLKSETQCGRIERVLKVHNTQKTIARFEEHRETVKIRATKLPKKHPRCLADGNELLRFHATTVACSLGLSGAAALCASEKCCVCRIIRQGFWVQRGGVGVFTASTSGRALESVEAGGGERKALVVCRVIAGRVHRPLESGEELAGERGFDSVAGKVGACSSVEELYLLSPRALLPCFVVICKPGLMLSANGLGHS